MLVVADELVYATVVLVVVNHNTCCRRSRRLFDQAAVGNDVASHVSRGDVSDRLRSVDERVDVLFFNA